MTIKNFTSLEQSRKLAEILPLESADMNYWCGTQIRIGGHRTMDKDLDVPCWSLAALLDVLPKQFGRYTKSLGWFDDAWHCVYMDEDSECKYCVSADNPLDACYEMILKLQELNLL